MASPNDLAAWLSTLSLIPSQDQRLNGLIIQLDLLMSQIPADWSVAWVLKPSTHQSNDLADNLIAEAIWYSWDCVKHPALPALWPFPIQQLIQRRSSWNSETAGCYVVTDLHPQCYRILYCLVLLNTWHYLQRPPSTVHEQSTWQLVGDSLQQAILLMRLRDWHTPIPITENTNED